MADLSASINEIPKVIILSSSNNLIYDITDGPSFTENITSGENLNIWEINNKYYSTSIQFHHTSKIEELKEPVLDLCETIIVYLESKQISDFESLCDNLDIVENVDVKLMVLDDLKEDQKTNHLSSTLSKLKVQEWCISNGWELVEMNPELLSDTDEEEDDFPDSHGNERIRQALNAHTWSNLKLNDEKEDGGIGQIFQAMSLATNKKIEDPPYSNFDSESEEDLDDSFMDLLSTLNEKKETAAKLPMDERRKYAEKMAIAFWRSMGGSEDEIEGVASDDNDI